MSNTAMSQLIEQHLELSKKPEINWIKLSKDKTSHSTERQGNRKGQPKIIKNATEEFYKTSF